MASHMTTLRRQYIKCETILVFKQLKTMECFKEMFGPLVHCALVKINDS